MVELIYYGKTIKNILLLATIYHSVSIWSNQEKTSKSVWCYNDTKYGIKKLLKNIIDTIKTTKNK